MGIYFIVILVIFLFLQHFVGQHIEVNGSSMENTLSHEDHLILEKVSYRFEEPTRFDIVVFRPYESQEKEDTYYIKRVMGMPGERIQVIDGQIYINGEILQEDYGTEAINDFRAGIAKEEILLEKDEYFLIGDNRNNSTDSRDETIGPVKRDTIIGRAWVRIWPISKLEVLDH
ncbi:MAG TPA: signal peptidase I [Clostridiales bacterium]|nr:signal peptidase I [Clostridiales bacterium]